MGNACCGSRNIDIKKVVVRRMSSFSLVKKQRQRKTCKDVDEDSHAFKSFKETGQFATLMQDHDFFYFLRGFLLHDFKIEAESHFDTDCCVEPFIPEGNEEEEESSPHLGGDLQVIDVETPILNEVRKISGTTTPSRTRTPTSPSTGSFRDPVFGDLSTRPSTANGSRRETLDPQTVGLRFLTFYADTTDYKALKPSDFKALRAEKIADTYIRHGAPLRLPLPRLLIEDIERKIDANANNPPPHIFDAARHEAADYLEAEVWPILKASNLLRRWRDGDISKRSRVYSLSHLNTERNEKFEIATEPLQKALLDSESCAAIKNFLRVHHPHDLSSLLFYLEVVDFEAMYAALNPLVTQPVSSLPPNLLAMKDQQGSDRGDGSAKSMRVRRNAVPHTNAPFLIMRASKIYDKYLKLGARQEIPITKAMRLEVRETLSNSLNGTVFNTAKEVSFRVLFENYREFLHSVWAAELEHSKQAKAERRHKALGVARTKLRALKLIRGASSSSLLNFSPVQIRGSSKSLLGGRSDTSNSLQERPYPERPSSDLSTKDMTSRTHDSHSSGQLAKQIILKQDNGYASRGSGASMGLDDSGESKSKSRDPDFKSKMLEVYQEYFLTLRESNKLHHFQRHLETINLHHYLIFYMEVEEYQMIPYTQKAYMKGRAHKIYDKYIKLSALLEIYLPEQIKHRILTKLTDPSLTMFDEAKQNIFEAMLEEWPLFMQTDGYKELVEEGALDQSNSVLASKHQHPDVPLYLLLEDQTMANLFKEFCDLEFYPQTVRFWLEVEEFKRTPSGAFLETRCNKLINMYIKEGALSAVPISNETRVAIEHNQNMPGPNLFEAAQEEVYQFMLSNLYERFKVTDGYVSNLDYIQHLQHSEATGSFSEHLDGLKMDMSTREHQVIMEDAIHITNLLHTTTGLRFFKEFCEQIYCPEMIFFWMEVEDYKQIPGEQYMARFGRKIVNKYVADHARMQINISHKAQAEVLSRIDTPTRDLFDSAQHEVIKMMERDTLPKFRNSKHYEEYVHYQRSKKNKRMSNK